MRNWMICSCVALALPCLAFAQQPAAAIKPADTATPNGAAARPKVADVLEAKVRDAWATFKRKDKIGYAKFLTDDFQAVESDGEGERTKRKVLGEVEHCMYTDFCCSSFKSSRSDRTSRSSLTRAACNSRRARRCVFDGYSSASCGRGKAGIGR
jgi:hypothetical protein